MESKSESRKEELSDQGRDDDLLTEYDPARGERATIFFPIYLSDTLEVRYADQSTIQSFSRREN